MTRVFRILVVTALFCLAGSVLADSSLSALIRKLERGVDFRVRVQAALQLGKTHEDRARKPLEAALDDDHAAVRAAAAAALKVLGDKRALPALYRHRKDSSAAVRAQVKNSIEALSRSRSESSARAELLVQMGKIRNSSDDSSDEVVEDATRTSRQKIDDLPGVEVLDGAGDSEKESSKRKLPLVLVSGSVKELASARQGQSVVISARIEFVLHKMPGQSIKGVVSGRARATGGLSALKDRRELRELRRAALEAAIDSAIRQAPRALRAAAE